MLTQYVTVLQGTLAPALLIMALNVMLTVGEGRDKPLSAYWRLAGFIIGFAGAIVFAALRAAAVINQRTFVNYPTLLCCSRVASLRIGMIIARCLILRMRLVLLRLPPPLSVRCLM